MQTTWRGETRSRHGIGASSAQIYSQRWMSRISAQALDQLNAGIIITDSTAEVVEFNRAAAYILQLEDGLLIRDDRLCARRAFETGKIIKLIAAATMECEAAASAGRMLIGRCDGLPAYVLSAAPLRTGLAVNSLRLAMIVVVDPQRDSPSQKDLREFFGLTPAEARLAAALLTGKTLAGISAISSVRITTLRTQLGSILRKVGAQRQSDLIRILSSTGIGSLSLSAGWFNVAEAVTQMPLWLSWA